MPIGFDPADAGPGGELATQIVGVLAITCAQAAVQPPGHSPDLGAADGLQRLLDPAGGRGADRGHVARTRRARLFAAGDLHQLQRHRPAASLARDRQCRPGCSCWAFCCRPTRSRASTPRPTPPKRRSARRITCRAASCVRCWSRACSAGSCCRPSCWPCPNMDEAAAQGSESFFWIAARCCPGGVRLALFAGIVVAQFFCGLATVTSASRMAYAFARDGGLPYSERMRHVSPRFARRPWRSGLSRCCRWRLSSTRPPTRRSPAACTIFLYISYVIPTVLGLFAYGRSWTQMGPWNLGGHGVSHAERVVDRRLRTDPAGRRAAAERENLWIVPARSR